MSSESLWIQIPVVVIIPLLGLFIITMVKGIIPDMGRRLNAERVFDFAMDLAVLALGASGGICSNDTLWHKWGVALAVYGLVSFALCILAIVYLAKARAHHDAIESWWHVCWYYFIGLAPLGLATTALVLGYTLPPGRLKP